MAFEAGQGFLPTQIGQRLQHLAFEPLQQLQRDIEKVSRAAGRVQYAQAAQLVMKLLDGGDGLFRLLATPQTLHRAQHALPILAQRINHGGEHQALHIGARRVMRAKLLALVLVQRLFKQCAENRRLHLAPIV